MRRNHSRTVLELFAVLIGLTWWLTVVLLPVQLVLALLRSADVIDWQGIGSIAVAVSTSGPSGVQLASGQVDLAGLPFSTALPASALWFASAVGGLVALSQLRRIVHDLRLRPLEPGTARRMRRLGPILLATVVGVGLQTAASAVVARTVPAVGPHVQTNGLFAGIVAAVVAVLFAEALRVATAMREEQELTI